VPWLIKNTLDTGNPIYPFFFVSGAMDSIRMMVSTHMGPYGNWMDLFLLPLRATVWGYENGPYDASIGPLLLGFGALSWIRYRDLLPVQKTTLIIAALISITGLFLWAIGNQFTGQLIQTRFYYLLFPAFATLSAFGYASISQLTFHSVRLRPIANTIVIMVLLLNGIETMIHTLRLGAPQAALGLRTEQDYLADSLGWFQPAMQAIRELPPNNKVLLIYEPRSLYCAPYCYPDEILDRWAYSYNRYHNDETIQENWGNDGFTYLIAFRSGVELNRHDNVPNHPVDK
jgi:hypothetical protein